MSACIFLSIFLLLLIGSFKRKLIHQNNLRALQNVLKWFHRVEATANTDDDDEVEQQQQQQQAERMLPCKNMAHKICIKSFQFFFFFSAASFPLSSPSPLPFLFAPSETSNGSQRWEKPTQKRNVLQISMQYAHNEDADDDDDGGSRARAKWKCERVKQKSIRINKTKCARREQTELRFDVASLLLLLLGRLLFAMLPRAALSLSLCLRRSRCQRRPKLRSLLMLLMAVSEAQK